jgi:hypothetical protein
MQTDLQLAARIVTRRSRSPGCNPFEGGIWIGHQMQVGWLQDFSEQMDRRAFLGLWPE